MPLPFRLAWTSKYDKYKTSARNLSAALPQVMGERDSCIKERNNCMLARSSLQEDLKRCNNKMKQFNTRAVAKKPTVASTLRSSNSNVADFVRTLQLEKQNATAARHAKALANRTAFAKKSASRVTSAKQVRQANHAKRIDAGEFTPRANSRNDAAFQARPKLAGNSEARSQWLDAAQAHMDQGPLPNAWGAEWPSAPPRAPRPRAPRPRAPQPRLPNPSDAGTDPSTLPHRLDGGRRKKSSPAKKQSKKSSSATKKRKSLSRKKKASFIF